MKLDLDYDTGFEPPAPVIAVRVSAPDSVDAILLPMLVDTGADCTIVPAAIVQALELPATDVVAVTGLGGAKLRATAHAALLNLGPAEVIAEVMAVEDEPILGRDVLNQLLLQLDGPARRGSVRSPGRRQRPSR